MNRATQGLVFVAAMAAILDGARASSACAPGPTIWVTPAGSPTLQEALDCAGQTGAVVQVAAGTYPGSFTVPGGVRLVGSGPEQTILDAEGFGRTVTLGQRASIEGFTIMGGVAGDGGGLFSSSGLGDRAAVARGNVVRDNLAVTQGGGASGSLILIDNLFEGNIAGTDGGGAYLTREAGASGNWFRDNEAGDEGGGLYTFYFVAYADSDPAATRVWNNLFTGNRATRGGGVYISNNFCGPPFVSNNMIAGNTADDTGGGLFFNLQNDCDVDPPVLGYEFLNDVIVQNLGGGVAVADPFYLPLEHSDVWGNLPEDYPGTTPVLTGIGGNLSVDPGFRDPAAEDYRLTPGSPCIDSGTDAYPLAVAPTDRHGFPRPLDGNLDAAAVSDMGAFEERGEVDDLHFESDGDTVRWNERIGAASYNLYRGDLFLLRAGGDYTQDPAHVAGAEQWCGRPAAQVVDPDMPPPGEAFFYLATPVDLAEGSLGFDSSRTPRPHALPCS